MESQSGTTTAKAEADKTQERSSVEFPYTDLDNAEEVVNGVHNAGGTACDADQLAAQLDMEAKGGGFRARVNGAQTFKLVTYERGGRIALTDLGRQLIKPETQRQARMNAFLSVELYAKVYEEFKGGPLPPHAALERALEGMGVGAKVKDRARQVLLRSAKQAGFFDHASDRLIKPTIRETATSDRKDEHKPDQEKAPAFGGGNSGGGGNHPLIQGLLMTLPKPESPWSMQDRMNWLNMANSIFKMIYTDTSTDQINITYTKGNTAQNQ